MTNEPFFVIDVTSEIRNLCDAQLRGIWQMPAEIVRFAIRSGAREVSVSRGVRGFSFSWNDGPIGRPVLEDLAVALDDTAEPARRQQSIADLERTGAEALLWAGGLARDHLSIETVADGRRFRFRRRPGRRPSLDIVPGPPSSNEIVVRWSCAKLDRRRALLWLRLACRFSAAEIVVDKRPVPRGFSGGLYRTRLEEPLPCTIGLTRYGEEPVLWLLREGIVAARAALPGYPPFEAAVELGGVVTGAASSSDLRRAVRPFVTEVCERAVDMMIEVAGRPDTMSGSGGQRLLSLLLRSARRDLRKDKIRSLPLLPTLDSGARRLSLSRLEAIAVRQGGRVFAMDPGEQKTGVLVDPSSTIVASPDIRSLLTELTHIRLQPPPRRRHGVLRRFTGQTRALVSRVVERVRGMVGSRLIRSQHLSAGELQLVAVLRAALAPTTVDLGRGRRLRRTASGWILPRTDPAVRAAVECVAESSAWLYPLILAFKLDPSRFESLRKDWTTSVGSRSCQL